MRICCVNVYSSTWLLKYFFFQIRGQLNTEHKENFCEFGALTCFSPLIYSRLGYLLIHIWIFHYLPILSKLVHQYAILVVFFCHLFLKLNSLCPWLNSSNITTHDITVFFFASNFLNFIFLSPRINSTNKFEFVLQNLYCYQSAYGLMNLIFTNRPTAWRTLFLPIGLRPDEPNFYQSAYGLTNIIFTNRPTAWRTYFYQYLVII